MGHWVTAETPSMESIRCQLSYWLGLGVILGMCRPCQWIEMGSCRLFVTLIVRVSPERASIVGPGNKPVCIRQLVLCVEKRTIDEIDPLENPVWTQILRRHVPFEVLRNWITVRMVFWMELYHRTKSIGVMSPW